MLGGGHGLFGCFSFFLQLFIGLLHLISYRTVVFQHLESVIRARIPAIVSSINRSIDELEAELSRLGRSVTADAGVRRILCHLLSI